ncbi:pyridoxal-5'-phosphate-dependent protein [Rufibacter radiotolerans]|uniref:Pyridoxal-5'-phosphate-dependent protein n=1 Tax=Rufibacter radiotolerans TaxID=1379910 RepID=A0A0H4VLJ9_9BACT|nr:UDP-4-amino-4,6-dideoxy-N-acetyl-beta-L-altrosamine transaminase [Rufibacter radiotolerans]AKQ44782.1 pyridoxal-5'-phosphate-dependent protein [Rufibacter radiotolerans]
MIPYGKQYINNEDLKAVTDALQSDFLTQGPRIAEFEQKFSEYIDVKHSLAVSNGTAALHLAALALGVNEKSNVITTPITFAASANCIRYCGGNVYFADIDEESYLLDLNKVEDLIKSKPAGFFSGIIPVDFAGRAVNLEKFRTLADKYNLWIIEDACHAPGGYFVDSKGQKQFCGNSQFAEAAIFSFHPVKHIACGEGGMISCNDDDLYNKLLLLRTHGITKDSNLLKENHGGWYYEMQELGYNYRLTDFQAALGTSQLKRADAGLEKRREIARKYNEAFTGNERILGHSGVVEGHAYHLYIIEVADRLGLYNYLRSKNIFTQVHYIPVHTMPYYQGLGWKKGDFPAAELYYERCLSLPMFPTLENEEIEYVVSSINEFFAK